MIYKKQKPKVNQLKFSSKIIEDTSYFSKNSFSFLNKKKNFQKKIDWNFLGFGLLWNYNLCYFNYLHQDKMDKKTGFGLINCFYNSNVSIQHGKEPYPTSLRIINILKYLLDNNLNNSIIWQHVWEDVLNLRRHIEYHILANHILENAFSLYFASIVFESKKLNSFSKNLLSKELTKQIQKDGSHCEVSPMYHNLMLYRILDCIQILESSKSEDLEMKKLLRSKASDMLYWSDTIRWSNGLYSQINDSVNSMIISFEKLKNYAVYLSLKTSDLTLMSNSIYRLNKVKYEVLFKIDSIYPSYQPGHSHSDNLSLNIFSKNKEFIVDPGISTYEKGEVRNTEKSTINHNTVSVNGQNNNEIWDSFRVGGRGKSMLISKKTDSIKASVNYPKENFKHLRSIEFTESNIKIVDEISENTKFGICSWHLHPDVKVTLKNNQISLNDGEVVIEFNSNNKSIIKLKDYNYCLGFNKLINSKKIIITFSNKIETNIYFYK